MARISLGNISLDIISVELIKNKIIDLIHTRTPSQIVTLNSLMFNLAKSDPSLAKIISNAKLIIPDSIGISFAVRYLTNQKVSRIPGIDLVNHICKLAQAYNYRIFLLGSMPKVAKNAAKKLKIKYPNLNIVGTHKGYFNDIEESVLIRHIKTLKPDILLVGLSVPNQEKWIASNLKNLGVPIVVGVGGSFDVISGRLYRAPNWIQNIGLEWMFRLIQQPWRIKRIKNLPSFVWNVMKLKNQ